MLDAKAIQEMAQSAIGAAAEHPHRQSEILGHAALNFAGLAQKGAHGHAAPILIKLAEQFAQAAMQPEVPATTDDFHELLVERLAAREQGFDRDLEIQARSEAIHSAKDGELSPRVSIAPSTWGKGATLGRSGRFKYNPSSQELHDGIQQSATLAFWQGKPHEAQAITIDLAPVALNTPITQLPNPTFGIDTNSRPYGIVTYGSDGAITAAKFDAGLGRRLTVVGSYVAIVCGMDPPLPGAASGTVSYSASIGAFAAPSQAPITLTEYIDGLLNGATSAPIQIPQRAAQLLPVLSSNIGGTALLEFYGQGAGGVLLRFSYPVGQLLLPIPLPSELAYVTLKNTTGQVANFRLPFQLSV